MTEEATPELEETVAPDSETEDSTTSEEVTEESTETEETEDTTEETEEEAEKPKPKNKGFQKRINKLTRKTRELESELEAYKQQQKPKVDTVEAPKREDFESYEDFLEAKAEHVAETKVAERLAKQQEKQQQESYQREQSELLDGWEDKKDDARDRYQDFDDVVDGSDVPVTPQMSQALLESDIGADMAYYLANNEDEAVRISKLSPTRQLVELGKLETTVQANLDAPKKKAPSKAPPPVKPTKKKSPTATELPSDDDSTEEWVRKEQERLKRKYG